MLVTLLASTKIETSQKLPKNQKEKIEHANPHRTTPRRELHRTISRSHSPTTQQTLPRDS
ncbi:hypothetical protein FRIGORI9N_400120 [Frigoribacterium sp. 9N]|nr:hypothetical protein FRIGORI9N_400120 [Frigoribacterium sp. 9N]